MKRFFASLLPVILGFTALSAQIPGLKPLIPGTASPAENEVPRTEAALFAELSRFQPGNSFRVHLQLKHPKGWHSYYKNAGYAGVAPTLKWTLPEGWTASEPEFPAPHRLIAKEKDSEISTYVFEDHLDLLVTLSPPQSAALGQHVDLKLESNWQICNDKSCIFEPGPGPESFHSFSLRLNAAAEAVASPQAAQIQSLEEKLPKISNSWDFQFEDSSSDWILHLIPKAGANRQLNQVYFFAEEAIDNPEKNQTLEAHGDAFQLRIPKRPEAEAPTNGNISGILTAASPWTEGSSNTAILIPKTQLKIPTPKISEGVVKAEAQPSISYVYIFGGMFLGGLLLNLMPCVFPVIGLKIMGFVQQAGQTRGKIALHGMIFTLGVVLSFAVLAGILLYIRNSSSSPVGWGYQLQDPTVVWILLLIMLVMGLSMYGVFEIANSATSVGGKLQSKSGLTGTFFSGALATVVATPCSAPMLGTAIGAASALPSLPFLFSFFCMAIGLSFPYLLLSAFPSGIRFLPRPGAWMESFKQGMSFLLFGTAGFLTWVYLAQIDPAHGLNVFLGLSLIATAAWVYGRWFRPHLSSKTRGIAVLLSILLAVSGLYLSRPVLEVSAEQAEQQEQLVWEEWTQAKVDEALAQGRPVFVDFTAKWCLTCQLNKSRAYTPDVVKAFKDRQILALRGDKTRVNPAVEAAVKSVGRSAIPVNLLYVPGKKAPIVTPEVLTPSYLIELVEKEIPAK